MTTKHQTGLLFVYCIKVEFAGIFILKLEIYTVFLAIYCPFASRTFY